MNHAKQCLRKIQSKIGDCIEPDYIEADNESHGNDNRELFFVIGKDLKLIDLTVYLTVAKVTCRAYFENIVFIKVRQI